jgi:DNA-binding transcriptional MerR regulator
MTLKELASKSDVAADVLAEWTSEKLLRPAGYADDKSPLFPPSTLERLANIRKLTELGYGLEEILKIIKKVGLPQEKSDKKAADRDRFLTVGNLAERSGVSPRTIKHWEEMGIIEPDMRTEGGFRLYTGDYVLVCKLIRDLQLFGYSLEEIKVISDDVRALMAFEADPDALPRADAEAQLAAMLEKIQALFVKMQLLREGIERWEDLLKKKRKDILGLRTKIRK